jgi:hypothetical protein
MAMLKGKADGEQENAALLQDAARQGDAKAALAILQHVHGWVAKQSISVDVDQRISVLTALDMAQKRVIEANALDVTDVPHLTIETSDARTSV